MSKVICSDCGYEASGSLERIEQGVHSDGGNIDFDITSEILEFECPLCGNTEAEFTEED